MISPNEIIDLEQYDQESEREDNVGDLEEIKDVPQENEGETSTKIKPKPKRKVGSRPKLDAERLKGPRGLICMEKMFSELKFKGHGHEKQDLNIIMTTLQYWCHRLFPKFTFDDTLAQLERLGTKKPVITLKKKILFDMIEDLLPNNPDIVDDDEDDVTVSQHEELSEFDMLLNEQPIPTFTTQPAVTAEVVELTEEQKEIIARNRQLAAERRQARLDALKEKQSSQTSPTNSQSLSLTEELRLIIEKNRLLAVEKRRQLQNKFTVSTSECFSQHIEGNTTNQEKETENIDENETEMDVDLSQENNLESEILSYSSQHMKENTTSREKETEKIDDRINQESETEKILSETEMDLDPSQENNLESEILSYSSQHMKGNTTSQERENKKIEDPINHENETEKILSGTEMDLDPSQENNLESEISSYSSQHMKGNTTSQERENKKNEDPINHENETEKILSGTEMDLDESQKNKFESNILSYPSQNMKGNTRSQEKENEKIDDPINQKNETEKILSETEMDVHPSQENNLESVILSQNSDKTQ